MKEQELAAANRIKAKHDEVRQKILEAIHKQGVTDAKIAKAGGRMTIVRNGFEMADFTIRVRDWINADVVEVNVSASRRPFEGDAKKPLNYLGIAKRMIEDNREREASRAAREERKRIEGDNRALLSQHVDPTLVRVAKRFGVKVDPHDRPGTEGKFSFSIKTSKTVDAAEAARLLQGLQALGLIKALRYYVGEIEMSREAARTAVIDRLTIEGGLSHEDAESTFYEIEENYYYTSERHREMSGLTIKVE